jgi:hypothetical protein
MGISTINGPFSIAMLVYQRVETWFPSMAFEEVVGQFWETIALSSTSMAFLQHVPSKQSLRMGRSTLSQQ